MESQSGAESPRRRRRVWPWVVLAVVVVLFLLVAGIVALALAVASAGGGSESGAAAPYGYTWEEQYVTGGGQSEVAIIPVEGTIAGAESQGLTGAVSASPEALTSQLDKAAEDGDVEAVILSVNSPGGSVVASDEMHDEIVDFKRRTGKPVVVSMEEVAASGGYYISAPADRIVANEGTFTGSIGVIFSFLDLTRASEKYGIDQIAITSGEFKDIGSSFEELESDEREILQSLVDDSYDQFVEVIVQGRGIPEDRVREIGDGRIYTGSQAEEIGLVDELGNLDDAISSAEELANVSDARVVRYTEPPGFFEGLQARIAPEEPEAMQALEAAGMGEMPKLQYLYRPGL